MNRSCWCDWPECNSFDEKLKSLAHKDDVWNMPIIQYRYRESVPKMTEKKRAAYSAMHRCVANESEFKKTTYLRPYHFPRSLLHWRNDNPKVQLCTSLKKSDTNIIELNDVGKSRFGDYTNSVFYYNKKIGYCVDSKFKKQFVQAPMSSKKEVSDFISSLSDSRKKIRSSVPFISPVKKNTIELDNVMEECQSSAHDEPLTNTLVQKTPQKSSKEFISTDFNIPVASFLNLQEDVHPVNNLF